MTQTTTPPTSTGRNAQAALSRLEPSELEMVFQPVVDLVSGEVIGAESAVRFRLAGALELRAVELALRALDSLPAAIYLSVKASPDTVASSAFHTLLATVPGHRVVVELTEHERIDDYEALRPTIGAMRERGVRLAVADAGSGQATFQDILELRPDIIKLDRALTNELHRNPVRQALAHAMVTFAASFGARVCAEGIETVEEVAALQRLGIRSGQGPFLARSGTLPLPLPPRGPWFVTLLPVQDVASRITEIPPTLPRIFPGNDVMAPLPATASPAVRSLPRLEALRSTGLMDSESEEMFDRFTRLAARLLHAPVAMVSLVDDTRQFFKSAIGISTRETPISHSICSNVVTNRSALVIPDATRHPLVRHNPAVREHNVRSYAGVPIVTGDDHALGALCVTDSVPRTWTIEDVQTLRDIGAMVSAQIDARRRDRRHDRELAVETAIFGSSGLHVMLYDLEGHLLRASRGVCQLFGVSESMLRASSARFLHPSDHRIAFAAAERLLRGESECEEFEGRYRTPAGGWSTKQVSLTLSRDLAGAARYFIATLRD